MSDQPDPLADLRGIVKNVVDAMDADILLYSGGIYPPSDEKVMDLVCQLRSHPNVLLMLTTLGGSPDAAYRIARCLKQAYKAGTFTLFVDTHCKSAGTLVAMGADQLIMSDRAHLGPLDIQLWSKDEVGEMSSGLTPSQALETLTTEAAVLFEEQFRKLRRPGFRFSTRMAGEIAAQMAIGLLRPVYEQIDPMRLGENQRAVRIAMEYGSRLATNNLKERTLARLITGYPSHGFIIDRIEAADLFEVVESPTPELGTLASVVQDLVDMGQKNDENGLDAAVQMVSVFALEPRADTLGDGGSNEQADRADGAGAPPRGPEAQSIARDGNGDAGAAGSTGGTARSTEAAGGV